MGKNKFFRLIRNKIRNKKQWNPGSTENITEKKETEERIKKTADEWEIIFNAIPDLVSIQDKDFRILKVNKAYSDLFKTSPKRLIGRKCYDVVHGIKSPCPDCSYKDMLKAKEAVKKVLFDQRSGRYLEITMSPILDKRGEVVRVVHVIKDITEYKTALKSIETEYAATSVINAILHLPVEKISVETLMMLVLEHVLAISWLSIESKGAIFLVDEKEPETLIMKAQRGLAQPLLRLCAKVKFGHCLCGRAALSKKIVFSHNLDGHHETTYEGVKDHGHYCVPIIIREKVVGVLNTYLKQGHMHDGKEEDFLKLVADSIAGLLERKKAQEDILNSKATIQNKLDELEKFHNVTVGRELKMVELKKKVEELEKHLSSFDKQKHLSSFDDKTKNKGPNA